MPELKRLFVKGRMNKDLDERLVPNGEYRDALNIQVGSSEGSDVGAIENILGNKVARKKKTKQLWADNDETHNYYGLSLDATCIGAIKDDINDKIYYFVTSPTVDCIIEYDKTRDYVQPVLVDTQNILNFSQNKLITGINIIDNYLFFTDDNSEPKKVDIRPTEFISTDFSTHSTYKGRNFIESDITVIKKSPLSSPAMELSNNSYGDINGIDNVITTVIRNFTEAQGNGGGLGSSVPPGTSVAFTTNSDVAYAIGNSIILSADPIETDDDNSDYLINLRITAKISPSSYIAEVINISSEVPDDNEFIYNCEIAQEIPPFETKFPRFAYRWQYIDNQYSTFSPFTEVAFLPSNYEYNAKKGYNTGMVNNVQKIILSGWETPPVDVKKIQILYKETNNATVYAVDDFKVSKLDDPTFTFNITSSLISKVIQSNQLLRPWDNVPRLAKAQEIVGNRIIYGNYLQNYTVNEEINLGYRLTGAQAFPETPLSSIKSNRKYQLGIVFKDEYGRETPVFTNSEGGSIDIPSENSIFKNKIVAQGVGPAPDGFTHYKYFIKDPSNQYYNLGLDRMFKSKDGVRAWLAFPSSERNKVTEESYLILKKGHDVAKPIFATDNKYKVLSISNEAPTELIERRSLLNTALIAFGTAYGNYVEQTTRFVGRTPTTGSTVFLISQQNGGNGVEEDTKAVLVAGNYIRFTNGSENSRYYEINNAIFTGTDDAAKVFVTEKFLNDVEFLYDSTDAVISSPSVQIEIYGEVDIKDKGQFQGKFFVNVEKNSTLVDNLFKTTGLIVENNMRFRSWGTSTLVNGDTVISTTASDGYNYNGNLFVQIWGGGHAPYRGYSTNNRNGGLLPRSGDIGPLWANGAEDTEFDIVFERVESSNEIDFSAWAKLGQVGTKLRFNKGTAEQAEIVYTIEEAVQYDVSNRNYVRIYVKFDRRLAVTVNPNFYASSTINFTSLLILGEDDTADFQTSNPAVFETEPKEQIDLDIYYEASKAYPIAEYNTEKTLDYFNCYSFGNGVESNRIRDDFNAPFIDKGTKASTVLEEPYEEERRATGLIYSGIFNSNSGLNDLNQFIQAEKITKDLNPIYGSIQKLHTRDTNLVTLCEDKCLRILANKDALFNADGNTNVTSNNNVLGQAMPFAGEFGISKNPESFASYGYRAYFSDKKRGVVLRLSMDGLTEISSKGMSDYFYDNLKAATTVIGSYDIYSDAYTLTLNNDTVCFKESLDGWPTRKSFIPEWGISLNADYYTMDNGMIWAHDNEERNTFYEGTTAKSSVQLIFNDNPNKIKNFKTISYEGDSEWTAPLIQTDQQDGAVTTFLDKENIYYNYIKGLNDTWDNSGQAGTLDLKQFAAQGIANLASVDTYNGNTTFKVVVKNNPADAETTYTVTEYDIEAEAGDQVNLDVTEFALNITPVDGYVIDAADFSIGDALPSQIATVVFSNGTGGVVKATCTFDASFIMPSNDVEILIDIDGIANLIGYTVDGEYTISQTNTQESATTPVAFSQTGQEGDEVTLFTKTFTATTGYYYSTTPYYYQTLGTARNESNYIITASYSGSGPTPEEYYLQSVTFTVKYIIGNQNETLNDLNFVADAVEIYTPLTEVTSYSINLAKFQSDGTNRQISFYGGAGAEVTFTTTHPYPVDSYIDDNNTQTLTLNDSGTASMTIIVPENTTGSNQTWTFTLSGADLASPFGQTNPFSIVQLL